MLRDIQPDRANLSHGRLPLSGAINTSTLAHRCRRGASTPSVLDRHAAEGQAGLRDRSSRPHRSPTRQAAEVTASIEALRRQRRSGPAIARQLGLPGSTVGLTLRRIGLNRLAALDPKPVIIRYEREHPGELIHIDIKKLGRIDGVGHRITGDRTGQSNKRGTGWEYLHVAIDDASRLAFTAMLPDERKESAVTFLNAALAWFKTHGVIAQRIITDNGSAYRSKSFAEALARHGLKHKRTRPYTPKTNGKAERFIRPASARGPKPRPSRPPPQGPPPCIPGYMLITPSGHTPPSREKLPSPERSRTTSLAITTRARCV